MNQEFALHVSDVRLLQTLRLLELTMKDHPDQTVVMEALDAISASRDHIANLAATPKMSCECCA